MQAFALHHDGYPSVKFSRLGLLSAILAHIVAIALLVHSPASPIRRAETVLSISLIPAVAEQTPLIDKPGVQPLRPAATASHPPPRPRPAHRTVAARPIASRATTPPGPARVAKAAAVQAPAAAEVPAPTAAPAPAQTLATAARFDADYLDNPRPDYPLMARRLHEEGRVLLRVQVSVSGEALAVQLQESSGSPRLDRAAIDTVQRWRFVPARLGEHNVAATVLVPVEFSLRS